jgi:hypothetical protein
MGLLDTHELHRLAARLDAHSEAIGQRGRQLSRGVQVVAWNSPAADVLRGAVGARVNALERAAAAIAGAAAVLRAHARVVQIEQDALLAAARVADVAAQDAHRMGAATVEAGATAATAALRTGLGVLGRLEGLL